MASKTEKLSADINLTLEDFTNSKWEEAFREDDPNILAKASDALAKMGQTAAEEEKISQSKALWILADACSMMLQPSSVNEPFKPFFMNRTNRSAIPDDFSEQDLDFFQIILPAIDKPELKARLSDSLALLLVHDLCALQKFSLKTLLGP